MNQTWIYLSITTGYFTICGIVVLAIGSDSQNKKPVDLWLLGLFPFNGSWPGGLGQLPAVQMGIRDVNEDPNMLPGYRIHMTINDTQVCLLPLPASLYSPGYRVHMTFNDSYHMEGSKNLRIYTKQSAAI